MAQERLSVDAVHQWLQEASTSEVSVTAVEALVQVQKRRQLSLVLDALADHLEEQADIPSTVEASSPEEAEQKTAPLMRRAALEDPLLMRASKHLTSAMRVLQEWEGTHI
ncbi:MAG: hypothetical protein ACE5JD_01765 [Candidatus Methylomirabilia bacterium]